MTHVFLCAHRRTPIGRYAGALAQVRPDDLATRVIDGLLDLHDIPVDEVIFGCANQAGEDNRNVARMAVLLSRLGPTVPALTVNRLCASGLDAVITAARAIRDGAADIIIAGGVESMSRAPFVMPKAETRLRPRARDFRQHHRLALCPPKDGKALGHRCDARNRREPCRRPWHHPRGSGPFRPALSQSRYDAAWHAAEILPVTIPGRKGDTVVSADEHPRPTSLEKLASLPTPFRSPGTVTAGNASGVNDGAAAVILASEAAVRRHGLTPLARLGSAASGAVEPRIMGIGPVEAARRLQARTGRAAQDHEVIELNEAFAAQVLACTRAWRMADDDPRLNAHGGAIAMGHPLGMSGARLAGTAARRLAETGARSALVTLCVGVGQGVALELLPA